MQQLEEDLIGARKAAALLVALGEDEIERIGKEMNAMETVPFGVAEKVLEEFHHSAVKGRYVSSGGAAFTKKLLQKALGPDGARTVIDLSLIHISEPTRLLNNTYADFC